MRNGFGWGCVNIGIGGCDRFCLYFSPISSRFIDFTNRKTNFLEGTFKKGLGFGTQSWRFGTLCVGYGTMIEIYGTQSLIYGTDFIIIYGTTYITLHNVKFPAPN